MSHELDELIKGEKAFLSSNSPPDEKLWTAIAGSVAIAATPRVAIAASGVGSSAKSMGAKMVSALVAKGKIAMTVAAIGGAAGVGTVVGLSRHTASVPAPNVAAPAAAPQRAEPGRAAAQPSPDPQSVAEPQPEPRPPQHRATAPAPAVAATDTFTEELYLIRKAQRELAADNPGGALATLREHRRQFGVTQFAEDRSALTALALCASGKLDEGRAEAQRLLRRAPSSVYVNRLRALCVMPGP